MEREEFEALLDNMFNSSDDIFKEFLNMALKLWDYRVKGRKGKKGNPYGIEYIFQTYIVEKLYKSLPSDKYDLYFSESILNVVRDGNYEENVFFLVKRCIQPDIVVVKRTERKIDVIMEIKCIENGCWNWVLSADGKEENRDKGDIAKLQKIKQNYPEILCYELVINRGKWDSDCWGSNDYKRLLEEERCIEEKESWELSKDLSGKLIEVLR